jgi:DNA-binding SARP family transcriptional activator
MNGRTRIACEFGATLAITVLLLVLALAWGLRPTLPPLPQSFSAPLPSGTIGATLDLAAWIVFMLLDLVLIREVLQFAIRRRPTRTELRLRRAFAQYERSPLEGTRDWRAYAAPLAPAILRIPTGQEPAKEESTATQRQHHGPRALPRSVEVTATDTGDEGLGVLLLGPLELTGCKKKRPRRQATAELIAFLAVQGRPANRDELLEALWPGDDPRRSAARFYQAVSEARKLLGDAFQRDRDTYALNRQQLRLDLDDVDRLQKQVVTTTMEQQGALLERALALFRGEPFEGIGALWAESERRRLTALWADLLDHSGSMRLESGDASGALELADEAAALDGSNERPVQLAIEAESALGRRSAVVERYERLAHELDQRFGLEPSRETKQLYRRLLSQDPDPSRADESRQRLTSGEIV